MNRMLAAGVAALAVFIFLTPHSARSSATAQQAREIAPLQLEEEIPVPNVAGRLDHFTADAKRKRLFVSALGNNTLEVIDVFSGKVIHSIQGLSEPQGPLYLPDFDKLYVANAGNGKVNVYDGATYTLRKAIEMGEDPDNMRYDAAAKKVFVGFGEEDGGIATIDPATDERVGDIFKTGGHPESFQV
jgi:DNA-binding beta-propeller fold protein YncE